MTFLRAALDDLAARVPRRLGAVPHAEKQRDVGMTPLSFDIDDQLQMRVTCQSCRQVHTVAAHVPLVPALDAIVPQHDDCQHRRVRLVVPSLATQEHRRV